jgi:50S ribosomal protein L16 3-hydroxylase
MQIKQLLGGLSIEAFLRDYWQKRPLLVRNAIPGFKDLIEPKALFALTGKEDTTARMVHEDQGAWDLLHGPFTRRDFPSSKSSVVWTVLVQELNHHLRGAEDLLQQFDFIPHARLDDLMVSYAVPGGGVGPHFDSYDVFLLQGRGQRRWQISAQTDLSLIDGLPLKILQHFTPEQEWVLSTGDMLYLPPCYAHNGIAVDECMTYSVGFRAPSTQEIVTQFLIYLQDRLQLPGIYQDPDLQAQAHPAQISETMLTQMEQMIQQLTWTRADIADFLGRYLTEPKAHVYFNPPDDMPGFEAFCEQVVRRGIRLAPQSRMLFHENRFYLNGEPVTINEPGMLELADRRAKDGSELSRVYLQWLYEAMEDGFVVWDGK